MALIDYAYCRLCESTTQHINRRCAQCADRDNRQRIAVWNSQTTEEKLQDLRKRVEQLESNPPTY